MARTLLILHIGVHRTGTTTLQRLLHRNRERLREQDIHYPLSTVNHNGVADAIQQGRKAAKSAARALVEDIERAGLPRAIVSAENLSNLQSLRHLKPLRSAFEVKILCYLRRQDRWLESWYNQAIRWPWNAELSRLEPKAFFQTAERYHWLDYARLHERWATAFGAENVTLRVYEDAADRLIDDFCAHCVIDVSELEPPARHVNASASTLVTEAIRHLDMIRRPGKERIPILRSVNRCFDALGLEGPDHVFTGDERAMIFDRSLPGNRHIARSVMNASRSDLFPGSRPRPDPHRPDLRLPPAKQLLPELAGPFVAPWSNRMRRLHGFDEPPGPHEPMAFDRLLKQRYVEARKVAANSVPALMTRVARGPSGRPETSWVDREYPEPVEDRATSGLRSAGRQMLAALQLDGRDAAERSWLEHVVCRWEGLLTSPDEFPETGEALLREWFSPLADVLAATHEARVADPPGGLRTPGRRNDETPGSTPGGHSR